MADDILPPDIDGLTSNFTQNSSGALTSIDGNPITASVVSNAGTSPNTNGMIRNINQTVQEREIIRTCPDLIIYLDGKTYLLNPYVINTKQNTPYTFVSFNDYVQNFSLSVDVDQLVPSANFTLQIPNMHKYLFQAPGGNNLIISMMEVQVFAKGYYAAANGNTIYHRVFKGVSAHVAHTDNGMFLEISIQCLGVMHFMEFMYVDLNPSNLSNSSRPKTPMTSNQANMNPYEMLADTFLRGVTLEGFQLNSIIQDNLQNDYWTEAVKANFCNKWQPILENLRKEVHILGYKMGSVLPSDMDGLTQKSPDYVGSMEQTIRAADANHPTIAQNTLNADFYVNVIRGYLPDMGIGSIQLANGRIVSRLEKIRTIVQMIGYEGFQDLDGTIIFKPPLYNLDVTNVGKSTVSNSQNSTGVPDPTINITDATNPFIVHLSEIESESESEDEQAVKATRVTIQPDWMANNKFIQSSDGLMRPAVTHIDIPKLAKFGLREEPARTLGWLGLQDKIAVYVYAVSELNRGNRGWRAYNITIPLRPELKLGFPMYLPHKDMYGYIKTISISYSQGGTATMSIMLDTLRKRPVFPQTTSASSGTTYGNSQVVYTTQPNLVMQWTTATSPSSTSTPSPVTNSAMSAAYGLLSVSNSAADLLNLPATQLQSPTKPIYAEEMEVVSARRNQFGTSWETKADTRTANFRIQNDSADAADAQTLNGNGVNIQPNAPFFSAVNWYSTTANSTVGQTTSGQSVSSSISAQQQYINSQLGAVSVTQNPDGTVSTTAVGAAATVLGSANAASASSTTTSATGNRGINMTYLQKILSCQPYTDEGGYEVVTPFPWGRWKNLKEAISETHLGVLVSNATAQTEQQVIGTDVFLFAGVGSVGSSTDASSNLQSQLHTLSNASNQAMNATSFELVNPPPGNTQPNILNNMQPDSNLLLNITTINTNNATDMFLVGNIPPQEGSALALSSYLTDNTDTDSGGAVPTGFNSGADQQTTAVIQNNLGVVGTSATSPTTQSQQFISKLINSNSGTTKSNQ